MHQFSLKRFCVFLIPLMTGLLISGQVLGQDHSSDEGLTAKEKRAIRKRERMRWSVNRTALGYARTFDEMISRRSYNGPSLEIGFGFLHRRADRISSLIFNNMGYFQPAPHGEANMVGGLSILEYRYLWRIDRKDRPGLRLYAGGSLGAFANARFNTALGNSTASGEWAAMLSPTGRVEYEVERLPLLKGNTILTAEVTLPLLSVVGRLPSWSLPGFEPFSTQFRPIGSFTRVQTELGILRRLGKNNPNLVKLSYGWELYGMSTSEVHRLRWASHTFGLTYYFRRGNLYEGQK